MRIKNIGNIDGYIAKDGKTDYDILISNNEDVAIRYAAEELQRLIKLASSAETAVTVTVGERPVISLSVGKGFCPANNRNGFAIKTEGKNVYIDGADKNGMLFGVYRFMEYVAGYMYLAPDETKIGDCVEFREIDIYDYPDFANRDVYNYDTKNFPENERRLFLSGGNFSKNEEKYGEGSWWAPLWDQSLCDQLADHNIYRKKYPHWYSSPNDSQFQLCFTEALYSKDEYDKGDFSEENYADGRHGLFWTIVYNLITNYVSVYKDKQVFQLGINDNHVFCSCERCNRDVKKYEQSGVCVRFINAVADEVEKWRLENCPERTIYLSAFAYQPMFNAPMKEENGEFVPLDESVIVRDNVIIRYAPIDAYYMFPLEDEKHNLKQINSLRGWAKIAKRLAVWDYRIDFYAFIAPFPQWMAAEANMKMYHKYGLMDVMYQGSTQTTGTPFVAMDNYVRARFSWDTSLDYVKLTEYFIDGYYGEAAFAVKEYLSFLTEHYKKIYIEQDYKGHSHFGVTRRYNYSFETILHIEEIFKKGYAEIEKLKESNPGKFDKLKFRLDRESLFYRFMKVAFYPEHYTNDERIEEIGIFEQISKKANLRVVCNKDDYTFNVIHVLRMPLEDRKGQIIYY